MTTTPVPTGYFKALATGEDHACAIRDNGELACWGDNSHGQASPPAGRFVHVSASYYQSCAVRDDGTRTCWHP